MESLGLQITLGGFYGASLLAYDAAVLYSSDIDRHAVMIRYAAFPHPKWHFSTRTD